MGFAWLAKGKKGETEYRMKSNHKAVCLLRLPSCTEKSCKFWSVPRKRFFYKDWKIRQALTVGDYGGERKVGRFAFGKGKK